MVHCPITAIADAFARADASSESSRKSLRRSTAVVNATTQMAPSPAARRARRRCSRPIATVLARRPALPSPSRSPTRAPKICARCIRRSPSTAFRRLIKHPRIVAVNSSPVRDFVTQRGRVFTAVGHVRCLTAGARFGRVVDGTQSVSTLRALRGGWRHFETHHPTALRRRVCTSCRHNTLGRQRAKPFRIFASLRVWCRDSVHGVAATSNTECLRA